jgi:hypothetical protein
MTFADCAFYQTSQTMGCLWNEFLTILFCQGKEHRNLCWICVAKQRVPRSKQCAALVIAECTHAEIQPTSQMSSDPIDKRCGTIISESGNARYFFTVSLSISEEILDWACWAIDMSRKHADMLSIVIFIYPKEQHCRA